MERGKGKWESAWDTGQYHGGVEGQKKSEIVYFLEVKGNGEEGNSINHGSWGPTRCATIILCERSPVSLEKSNFSYTPGMASCSRHEEAFGHLPESRKPWRRLALKHRLLLILPVFSNGCVDMYGFTSYQHVCWGASAKQTVHRSWQKAYREHWTNAHPWKNC